MARLAEINGKRPFERVHQTKFDTLVRAYGSTNVGPQSTLFTGRSQGEPQLTNLQQGGTIASDGTFIIRGIRCLMYFQALNASETAAWGSFGSLTALANTTATPVRAADLYNLVGYGTYFTLTVGNKAMLTAPLWYAPSAGGINGFTTVNDRSILSNGVASHEALLRLSKDIFIPQRQNFSDTINFYPYTLGSPGVGGGGGAITPTTIAALDYLNQFDGLKIVQKYLDGIEARDVQ